MCIRDRLLSRATTDLMLLRMFLAFPLTFLLVNGVTILVGVIIMLLQDWTLGLVILGPVVPVIVMCVVFEKRYAEVARRAQDQVGDLTTVVEESVLGIRIIKGFGRHRSQARAFRELSWTLRGTELRKARLLAVIWAVIVTLPEVAVGAALVVGCVQVADGALSAGTLVAFLSTALALRWPVESIGFLLAMSQEAATATERFFEVMDEDVESAEPGRKAGPVAGSDGLRFHAVSFRYPDAAPDSPPVLDRIDLHIRPGESMALVGATGSGKTTLTALVPRLHEVTSGRITLDGADIMAMSRAELRAMVAVAFEEPTLFSASVGENVLMGADDTAGALELERALSVAQADFAHALPDGTGTQVGEAAAVPGAGRSAVRARRAHRGRRGGRAAGGAGGDDRADRGAPPVHRAARRPGRAAVRGADHRGRHPSRTAALQRRVRASDVGIGRGGPAMTAPTTTAPAKAAPAPEESGDPFDRDVLPTPPGATGTLLRSLLAPMKARVALTTLLLLVQQAAVQAGPLLVAYAIDEAVPAFRRDDHGPLIAVAVGYLLCAVVSGALQYAFVITAARVNQDVLLDLRGRIFRHAQALSVDFHERYTSGRLISRSTADVESLRELLSEGLQELVTVILSFVYISAMLLWLDLGLGAVAVASFVPLYVLMRGYRRRARGGVPAAVDGHRRGDREVRGDDERHPAGARVPPRGRQRRRLRRTEPAP